MVATRTIVPRPRAGFPAGWATAGKTGAGNGHTNDIALVGRPDGAPLLVSAFYAAPRLEGPAREAVLAAAGRIVAAWAG